MLAPTTTRTLRLFVSATSRCSIEASEWIELVYLTLKFGYTEQNKIIFFCDFVPVASIPTTWILQTITVTSEHIRFYFSVVLLYTI